MKHALKKPITNKYQRALTNLYQKNRKKQQRKSPGNKNQNQGKATVRPAKIRTQNKPTSSAESVSTALTECQEMSNQIFSNFLKSKRDQKERQLYIQQTWQCLDQGLHAATGINMDPKSFEDLYKSN